MPSYAQDTYTDAQIAKYEIVGISVNTKLSDIPKLNLYDMTNSEFTASGDYGILTSSKIEGGNFTSVSFVCPELGGNAYEIKRILSVSGLNTIEVLKPILEKYGKPTFAQNYGSSWGGYMNLYWSPQSKPSIGDNMKKLHGLVLELHYDSNDHVEGQTKLTIHSAEGHAKISQCKEIYRRKDAEKNLKNVQF